MQSLDDSDIPFSAYFIVAIVCVCLFFVACGKRGKDSFFVEPNLVLEQRKVFCETFALAKFDEFPLPVGFIPLPHVVSEEKSSNQVISFLGDLEVDSAIHFYRQAIDGYGWDIQDFSVAGEGLLYCSKMHKNCIVSIRSDQVRIKKTKKTKISIFILGKKNGEEDFTFINAKKVPIDLQKNG